MSIELVEDFEKIAMFFTTISAIIYFVGFGVKLNYFSMETLIDVFMITLFVSIQFWLIAFITLIFSLMKNIFKKNEKVI